MTGRKISQVAAPALRGTKRTSQGKEENNVKECGVLRSFGAVVKLGKETPPLPEVGNVGGRPLPTCFKRKKISLNKRMRKRGGAASDGTFKKKTTAAREGMEGRATKYSEIEKTLRFQPKLKERFKGGLAVLVKGDGKIRCQGGKTRTVPPETDQT